MPVDRRISCRSPEIRAHCAHLRRRHHNVRVRSGLAPAGGNRHGYAGYEFEPVTSYAIWHVRHRVLNSDSGRWIRRDPLEYIDGPHLVLYGRHNPPRFLDSLGLACQLPCKPDTCFGSKYLGCELGADLEIGSSCGFVDLSCIKPAIAKACRECEGMRYAQKCVDLPQWQCDCEGFVFGDISEAFLMTCSTTAECAGCTLTIQFRANMRIRPFTGKCAARGIM